jgi:hypothetical protein
MAYTLETILFATGGRAERGLGEGWTGMEEEEEEE